mgnify:CR=1 FL=1
MPAFPAGHCTFHETRQIRPRQWPDESSPSIHYRNKGYEDALCMINENKTVKVYVKVEDVLTEENSASIKKVVEDITTLNDVDITSMK